MRRRTIAFAGLLLMTLAPGAWALDQGSSMFAIELTHGTADFADKLNGSYGGSPNFTAAYISAYDHSEQGIQGQFWYMMSQDYALAVTAGYGFFSETNKPGQGAAAGSPDEKFSTSSFNLRLGGDRVAKVSNRAIMYGGPGLEFWSGSAKFEPSPFTGTADYKDESVTRFGISARLGAIMIVNESFGLTTHVGGRYGYASVKEEGAEATWWPSSVEAAAGVIFMFAGR